MKQKAKILIFCMIFVGGRAFCQKKTISKLSFWPVDSSLQQTYKGNKFQTYYRKPDCDSISKRKPATNFSFLQPNYYYNNLAFFCRQEVKFEKATGIPFKFRLGSIQQCDWLEGKPNSTYSK